MMKLTSEITSENWEKLMRLYVEAFPPEERRPIQQMPPTDPAFRFYAIEDAGFLTAWIFPDFTYIEHFAIFPEQRGSGIGSAALSALKGTLILEVEPPESSNEAKRRISFYERNGFSLLDTPYMQPAYAEDLPPIKLCLMMRGSLPDIDTAIRTIHQRVYNSY